MKGSEVELQISNPRKQLWFQFVGMFPSGSLKGQLTCTGPHGEDIDLKTAESIAVRTNLAEISSLGGGRAKKCLVYAPKWLT